MFVAKENHRRFLTKLSTFSLGWQLICVLTEQLGGSIALERDSGTTVTVTFPLPAVEPSGAIGA